MRIASGSSLPSVPASGGRGERIYGTLVRWGEDLYGLSTPPPGTFIQVSAGWTYTCGVRTDGTLAC
jgi:hypothetical protein